MQHDRHDLLQGRPGCEVRPQAGFRFSRASIDHQRPGRAKATHVDLLLAKMGKHEETYALQNYQEILKTNSSNMERALSYPEAKKMVAQLSGTN